MQVIFAGGASAVGASCLLVSIGGHWIVVDAGVRMDRAADPLPDLALLEGKEVKAILVTHAHSDHIGSLPIVHKAFPTVPIYTSRASGLLMEVMLTDALTVMERRAVEEMEIPLYPKDLVARMLNKLRPLPVGETLSLPELPGVTIHTSRAGHIAGAICLGLEADDGSVVISGDISCTPQRTVQGAVPPALPHPDLLILESTYGARLHPNRQMEEQRLAQAVADGIERGGHVLIPAFGLGRSQEILLILQAAQEKGQIPPFQIFVDGLVRRVCDTYMLIPEALPPTLQRQIRRGHAPFRGPNVTFVRSPRERARVLAGPPAVIVSSSGMLSGGPSAWYAARLAGQEEASILITGYQDEEAPGRRLLSLVGQADGTLELDGQTVPVRCHVDKYALSAHADGHELASYAASLRPKQVALVHGDRDAREALQTLLVDTDVLLPENGTAIEGARTHKKQRGTKPMTTVAPLPALPQNIGQGAPLTLSDLQTLWQVIQAIPTLRIVTARELAGMWYEQASEEQIWQVLDTLAEDVDQRYFVRQAAMEEAYRVRVQGQAETTVNDLAQELVGQVLLLRLGAGNTKPALCQSLEGASIRVTLPKSVTFERTRFPFAAIIEVLGPADDLPEALPTALALEELVKAARPLRTPLLAAGLARQCNSEASYTLGDLCSLAELSSRDLAARLAVAKVVYQHPGLFFQYRTCLDGDGLTLYRLMPDWQEALAQGDMQVYMAHGKNQQRILAILEQHLGSPPDLYKCSLDPETCNLRLAFLFPAVARQRYADAIAAAAEEAEVEITLAPRPQQVALVEAAHAALPTSLQVQGTASLFFDLETIRLTCTGSASAEETRAAQQQFLEKTGWKLELVRAVGSGPTQSPASQIGKTA
ncbi:MAG TPA: MBL fold metallo-hydrolase, partial [Ktedonosporobacter sp.]|nr:MBL fold metallo-hydrolase [Ktedonosporobacter sp.]